MTRAETTLANVARDPKLNFMKKALGTHPAISRVQGGQPKAMRETRIAALLMDASSSCLRMMLVHEFAHLREPAHDKAFYARCCQRELDHHRLELDLRLSLAAVALKPQAPSDGKPRRSPRREGAKVRRWQFIPT